MATRWRPVWGERNTGSQKGGADKVGLSQLHLPFRGQWLEIPDRSSVMHGVRQYCAKKLIYHRLSCLSGWRGSSWMKSPPNTGISWSIPGIIWSTRLKKYFIYILNRDSSIDYIIREHRLSRKTPILKGLYPHPHRKNFDVPRPLS